MSKSTTKADIIDQVQHAYPNAFIPDDAEWANTKPSMRTNPHEDDRCLSFLTSDFIPMEFARDAIRYVGMYNAFDPGNLRDVFDVIRGADIEAKVAIGREGSPVLYFEVKNGEPADRVRAVLERMSSGPDELSFVDHDNVGPRDILANGVHSRCGHTDDEAPVPVCEEAAPDPSKTHIRAWWD